MESAPQISGADPVPLCPGVHRPATQAHVGTEGVPGTDSRHNVSAPRAVIPQEPTQDHEAEDPDDPGWDARLAEDTDAEGAVDLVYY